jgi:hypothetical protein
MKAEKLHDNIMEDLYVMEVASKKTKHTTGNPDISAVYIGDRFTGCANKPVHLLGLDLTELPGLPDAITSIKTLNVVYSNCTDCDGPDIETFFIRDDGKIEVDDMDEDHEDCDPESYTNSKKISYLSLHKVDTPEEQQGPVILGGEPRWAQHPDWGICCECDLKSFYLGRIYQFSLPPGAGGAGNFLYLFVCEQCKTLTIIKQTT